MLTKKVFLPIVVLMYLSYGLYLYRVDIRSRESIHICPPGVAPVALVGQPNPMVECQNQKVHVGEEIPTSLTVIFAWPLLFFAAHH